PRRIPHRTGPRPSCDCRRHRQRGQRRLPGKLVRGHELIYAGVSTMKLSLCLALVVLVVVFLAVPADAERHTPAPFKTGRSVTLAPNGMVATSHPLAAQIGLDVLKGGGNAVDAAIATSAAMGLLEPMSCGIGGDLFAIVWDAKTKTLHGLHANGRAPMKATREYFRKEGYRE